MITILVRDGSQLIKIKSAARSMIEAQQMPGDVLIETEEDIDLRDYVYDPNTKKLQQKNRRGI